MKVFNLNEAQSRFVKAHFSSFAPPVVLALVAVLAFRIFIFHRSSKEHLVDLKGTLTSIQMVKGATDAENKYELTFKEFPMTFVTGKMKIVDQQVLLTNERKGNDMKFSVEKEAFENNMPRLNLMMLKSPFNTYMKTDGTATDLSGDRAVAMFFALATALGCFILSKRLKKYYLIETAKPAGAAEVYDEYLVWMATNPFLAAKIAAFMAFWFLFAFLPGALGFLGLPIAVGGYFYFVSWYKKNEARFKWIEGAKTYVKQIEEKRKANKTATSAPKHVQAVQLLLSSGMDINMQNANGQTALHISTTLKSPEAVELLLRNNANPNLQDKDGVTPLIIATKEGQMGILLKLFEKGADPLPKDKEGKTALDHAKGNKKAKAIEQVIELSIKKLELAKKKEEELKERAAKDEAAKRLKEKKTGSG